MSVSVTTERCMVAIIIHGETGEHLKQVGGIPVAQFWPLIENLSKSALIYSKQTQCAPISHPQRSLP